MSRSSVRRASVHSPLFSSTARQRAKSPAGIDQDAFRLQAVAAGAARFLLVVLERLRRAGVHDEPDIGSIDAHAERDRRHHDVRVFVEERILVADAASSSSRPA